MEPKRANNSRTRGQVREGSSPVPAHPRAMEQEGAQGRGRNPTDPSAINAFVKGMGQRGFGVECDHTEDLMHLP